MAISDSQCLTCFGRFFSETLCSEPANSADGHFQTMFDLGGTVNFVRVKPLSKIFTVRFTGFFAAAVAVGCVGAPDAAGMTATAATPVASSAPPAVRALKGLLRACTCG